MNEKHLAKVNSNSKSKEKIQLSKWREQACFWRRNSNYHHKWREQACFFWRQISNSNRMRNICRNGDRSEADLAQCGALALPPPFLFLWLFVYNFFQRPLVEDTTDDAGDSLHQLFSLFGLEQLNHFATNTYADQLKSCLDLISTDIPSVHTRSTEPLGKSDHVLSDTFKLLMEVTRPTADKSGAGQRQTQTI